MVTKLNSIVLNGLDVTETEVEVGFSQGIPGIIIVGLPDNAVKESRERIRFAIKNSGFDFPFQNKIVVNLSPADIKKEGSSLDLPIAAAMLIGKNELPESCYREYLFYGELNLNGDLNPVRGILNLALYAKKNRYRGVIVPYHNRDEAAFVAGIDIIPCKNLLEVFEFLMAPESVPPYSKEQQCENDTREEGLNFSDINGQYVAKRAMEIAAAGAHNILMIGPPGSGKSMLSKALPTILPDMTDEEVLETSLIYSAAGLLTHCKSLVRSRPFRSPSTTISDVGISGGGKHPVPGEISLAHNGVLFLDELPYFKRSALEVLRQPLEDRQITISRSLTTQTYPANFMLVAAMNPCEDSVGLKDPDYNRCTDAQKRHYYSKISGPLLDRIDLQIEVEKLKIEEIAAVRQSENSEAIKKRVVSAREIQLNRFSKLKRGIYANSQMSNRDIKKYCDLDDASKSLLNLATEKLGLSTRGYFKMIKIARTIADLAGSDQIIQIHVQEALQYRTLNLNDL